MPDHTIQIPQKALLGLPAELRLNIFRLLWRSLVVEVERGAKRWPDRGSREETTAGYDISPLPGTPRDVSSLKLACKQFNTEIDDSWHSGVTYHFPTTVSFIDVLSQWSKEKICGIRYVHVVDTPLPLYAFIDPGFFVTHNFSQALPMFPGLQLDLLTVQNIWLLPNGEPLDDFCFDATNGTIKRLLLTNGWKRLEYKSGILALTPTQMYQMEMVVENYRIEQEEPDFCYGLGRVRPLVHSRENLLDRSKGPEDLGTTISFVSQWYAEHEEEEAPRGVNDYLEDVTELHVAVWAERGFDAKYVQDGSELSSTLESLKNNIDWTELRKSNNYLLGDGLDDPMMYM